MPGAGRHVRSARDDPAAVGERSDPLDVDHDLVAVGEEPGRLAEDADAGRRAGRDDVAGLQRDEARA